MKEFDTVNTLIEKFRVYINRMEETVSDKEPIAQSGEEKLSMKSFSGAGDDSNPVERINFLVLENGNVKNKDDPNLLDPTEFTVATFIPKDTIPLPVCCLELSFHFNKYCHFNADLFPVSKNEQYRETFCKPVHELWKKHNDLPGIIPKGKAMLQDYVSGGMMAGDFEWKDKTIVLEWIQEYADLYLKFLNERASYPILKDPSVIEEGRKIKATFLQFFNKATPRILSDVPNLSTDELGKKSGDIIF